MARTSRVHDRRACERCGGGLPDGSSVNRRYCPRCADARRALTYARMAHSHAIDAGEDSIAGRLGVIIGELEVASP